MIEVLFSDIKKHNHSVDLLFPHFLEHSRRIFPHLESLEELRHISDLTQPHTWYEATRSIHRKVIFHAGKLSYFFMFYSFVILRSHKQWQNLSSPPGIF